MTDGVAVIKVGSSVEDVATAAEQFLGKPDEALRGEAREVLEGHLRAILGQLTVEEVYRNRDKFAQEVQSVAARDLRKMGLQIVSFTIKDVRDKNGYLEALGKPRIAIVKRDAEIAEAEAIRDARIRKAVATEEGQKAAADPRHQRGRGAARQGAQSLGLQARPGHGLGRRRPRVFGPGSDQPEAGGRGADAGRAHPQAARRGPGAAGDQAPRAPVRLRGQEKGRRRPLPRRAGRRGRKAPPDAPGRRPPVRDRVRGQGQGRGRRGSTARPLPPPTARRARPRPT